MVTKQIAVGLSNSINERAKRIIRGFISSLGGVFPVHKNELTIK
jgi:hypothetical protein